MRAVKLQTIVAAIGNAGATWSDEAMLDRFIPIPRRTGVTAIAVKKLPLHLETLAAALSDIMPKGAARSFAGSLTLLRIVRELDSELHSSVTDARQSTEFELTVLHGGLLAARMLLNDSLREIVLAERSASAELRAAAVEEATADVVRRYAAAARGVLLQEGVDLPSTARSLDDALVTVSSFLRGDGRSFVTRTDTICDGLGIAR